MRWPPRAAPRVPSAGLSLARRLAVGFAALSAGITAALLALILPATTRQIEAEQLTLLNQLAGAAARTLDRTMADRTQDVLLTASLTDVQSGTPATRRAALNRVQKAHPMFAWLGLADAHGTVLAATGSLLEGRSVAGRPWFQQGRQHPSVGDVHTALLLSQLLPPLDGEPRRFVDISVPVRNLPGARAGVLGAHLSWSWVNSVAQDIADLAGPTRSVQLLILDQRNTVLHGPDRTLGQTFPVPSGGWTAPASGPSLTPGRVLIGTRLTDGAAGLPSLGWRVVVTQDVRAALAPVRDLQARMIGWGVLSVTVAAVLGILAARAATRPLRELTIAAAAAPRDRAGGTLPRLTDYAEIDRLSRVLQDLLGQRQDAQDQEAELRSSLERRVAERTAQLSEANAALERFSYSVSHDLRTPLRHLLTFPPLLRQAVARGQPDRVERHLDAIERAALRMDTMTAALLEFARSASQPLNLQPVDLAQITDTVRHTLEPDQRGRQVEWRLGVLPTVMADPVLVRLALENVLSNALKYSKKQRLAVIEVWAERDGTEWKLSVRDNGAGFDARYADRLFGVFQRLHADHDFTGTGVGLANVERIIARHGGRVGATGQPGLGATFWLTLPASGDPVGQPDSAH